MNIFDNGQYYNKKFMMQLPYLNKDGAPHVINIEPSAALSLYVHRICKCIHAYGDLYVMSPIKPAEQNVLFQIGEDRV